MQRIFPRNWQIRLGIVLVLASVTIYSIKYLVLGNPKDTVNYIFNAIGFLPINVLLVTLVLNELLSMRAKRERLEKLNMVIGIFFSEVGNRFLAEISDADPGLDRIRDTLTITQNISDSDLGKIRLFISECPFELEIEKIDLNELKAFLHEKREFLLRLLENPVLLEHQSFTEVLRAIFHLTEELERRTDIPSLPESDLNHLKGDIMRVYCSLSVQWMDYMWYLKNNYPYLFSLAMRTNPFDQHASVIVTG